MATSKRPRAADNAGPAEPPVPSASPAKKAPARKTSTKRAPARPAAARRSTPTALALAAPVPVPALLAGRFGVLDVTPTVESGRFPARAVEGEAVTVGATAFREGHDLLGVEVELTRPDGTAAQRVRMTPVGEGLDRWAGIVRPDSPGAWTFTVHTWHDAVGTWFHRAEVKVPLGQDVTLELEEGARLYERAAAGLTPGLDRERDLLLAAARTLRDTQRPGEARLAVAEAPDVVAVLTEHPVRDHAGATGPWPLRVERRRVLYGAWYELFPRSEGATASTSGTLARAAERLPAIAAMGFDVVYLPPVHPVGRSFRKGPNNTLKPGPDDPGSPWAIGAAEGGHDAVHPDLGTMADFDAFVAAAAANGMEIALDLALQAAPDHPWVREHPEWFTQRADGTIAYAENPPKKYQDIYPLNFDVDPEGLYAEVVRVVRLWMSHGVRIFRVDNPHTKPLWVWERLIREVNATDPDVFFLAEAFTRPPMMRALAEVGFQQSYTYFTWRTGKQELIDYFVELSQQSSAYMRPNVFTNTPDILHEYLQVGGRSAFAIRATLAATLSPTYGIYSGYELYEHVPVRPGSEEYLDSEKFQYRPRDYAGAEARGDSLAPYLRRLNEIRRAHPALQQLRDLYFHPTEDDGVLAFSKRDGDDVIIVACTLDPFWTRETALFLHLPALGLEPGSQFVAHDLLSDRRWTWGDRAYLRFEPHDVVAHVVHVRKDG